MTSSLETSSEANRLEAEEDSGDLCKVKVKVHRSWRSRVRNDLDFRRKILQSIWMCLAFFALSIGGGQLGPAFIDLQIITNTRVKQASTIFTASSAGYLTGSLLSGFVYDLLSKSLLLIVSLVGCGAMTLAIPYCRQYWLMVTVNFITSSFAGSVDTVGNADVLRTWGGKGEAALQAIHFTYAVGGVVAPLITEPFLTPIPRPDLYNNSTLTMYQGVTTTVSTSQPVTGSGLLKTPWMSSERGDTHSFGDYDQLVVETITGYEANLVNTTTNEHTQDNETRRGMINERSERLGALTNYSVKADGNESRNITYHDPHSSYPLQTRIHYAFMVAALMILLSALPFIAKYITGKKWRRSSQRKTIKIRSDQKSEVGVKSMRMQLPRLMYFSMLLWACGFYMVYTSVEVTFGSFLTYYVVNQMGWSKSTGALLTSVFYIFFASSRFACIFLTKVFTSVQLLMTCFTLMVLSLVGFMLSSLWQLDWGVWVTSAGAGAAMSAIFPSGLCWVDRELLPLTGRVTSAVMLAGSFGFTINPLILGHLMENQGAIWLAYLLLGEATLCVLIFVLLLLFSRLYLQTTYFLPNSSHDVSINVKTDMAAPECIQHILKMDHQLVS